MDSVSEPRPMQPQPEDGRRGTPRPTSVRQIAATGPAARPRRGVSSGTWLAGSTRVDRGGDPLVVRRDDLRAVLPVDLVAVVLGRVVAGGDHHRRRRASSAARRTRPAAWEPASGKTSAGMPSAASTAAVSSANSALIRRPSRPTTTPRVADVRHLRLEVARQPRGGAAHHRAVHPVGPRAEHAAQARGAELQRRPRSGPPAPPSSAAVSTCASSAAVAGSGSAARHASACSLSRMSMSASSPGSAGSPRDAFRCSR